MSQLVSAFFASCLLGVAIFLLAQLKALVVWFAKNPTMYTEGFGYFIPFMLVVIFVLIGRYYDKIKIL